MKGLSEARKDRGDGAEAEIWKTRGLKQTELKNNFFSISELSLHVQGGENSIKISPVHPSGRKLIKSIFYCCMCLIYLRLLIEINVFNKRSVNHT